MNEHVNFQNYLNLAENDWEFLGKLIHQSTLGLKELSHDYQKAIETQDVELLKSAVHKIKPTLIILESHVLLEYLEEAKEILGGERIDAIGVYTNAALVNQTIEEIIALLENYMVTKIAV